MTFKNILSYFAGTIFWVVLFSVLKLSCIVNVPWLIEGLWVDEVSDHFVRNLIGAVALDASPENYPCEQVYIYRAEYYSGGVGRDEHKRLSLTDVVDISSWEEVDASTAITTYVDNSYRYLLHNNSDGVYMEIFDK